MCVKQQNTGVVSGSACNNVFVHTTLWRSLGAMCISRQSNSNSNGGLSKNVIHTNTNNNRTVQRVMARCAAMHGAHHSEPLFHFACSLPKHLERFFSSQSRGAHWERINCNDVDKLK